MPQVTPFRLVNEKLIFKVVSQYLEPSLLKILHLPFKREPRYFATHWYYLLTMGVMLQI